MAFLKFNKSELVNLEYSLKREIIAANESGAYCNTSIVTCNTRRYHGLLAVPVDELGGGKYMLLSSLDESLVLGGKQFNLGIHCYGDTYEPRGHKYIIDFDADPVPVITYKVGGILFTKTIMMVPDSDQLLIKYELLSAPSKITLNLKPFLASRIRRLIRLMTKWMGECHSVSTTVFLPSISSFQGSLCSSRSLIGTMA